MSPVDLEVERLWYGCSHMCKLAVHAHGVRANLYGPCGSRSGECACIKLQYSTHYYVEANLYEPCGLGGGQYAVGLQPEVESLFCKDLDVEGDELHDEDLLAQVIVALGDDALHAPPAHAGRCRVLLPPAAAVAAAPSAYAAQRNTRAAAAAEHAQGGRRYADASGAGSSGQHEVSN
jgi:hypothetical protein